MPVNIIIDSKFDDKGIRNAESQLQNFAGNAAKKVAQVGAAVAAAGAAVAGKLAVDAVKAASDLGESVNAVNVAFGDAAEGVLAIGENAATAMGVSQTEFNAAAVRFSAFAERIVGEGGDVAGFIGDISVRAADFASVFNIEVSEALQVFQSGLAGEAEPLKRFGINLLQTEVAAYAVANGISTSAASMTEAEKVQARYGLLMEQTNKTQGDFANTSDSLANRQRTLQATFVDLQAQIGQALIPVAEELFGVFGDRIIPKLEEFGAWMESEDGKIAVQNFGDSIMGVTETLLDFGEWFVDNLEFIKTLGIVLTGVVASVYAYRTAVAVATIATAAFNATLVLNPFGAVAAAIALVTTGIIALASAIGNEATPTQEELNTKIEETEERLKFYREEQDKSTNSSRLYESAIRDLEAELIRLKEAQGQNIVFTKESVIATDLGREAAIQARYANENLAPAINTTSGAYGEMALQAINAKLGIENVSIAQQAQEIFMQKVAEGVSINAIENGLYASILADVTAKTRYQTQAQVDFNEEVKRAGIRLGLVVPEAQAATSSTSAYTSTTQGATTATNSLASSVDGLANSYSGLAEAASAWNQADYEASKAAGGVRTAKQQEDFMINAMAGQGLNEQQARFLLDEAARISSATGRSDLSVHGGGVKLTGATGELIYEFNDSGVMTAAPASSSSNVNVNVSAGVIANPNEVGEIVVDSIKKYESSNGKVFADAP